MAYESLVPCPSCGRHVRAAESACPFCDAALPSGLAARAIPGARERLSRAKLAVFGATASMALAACGTAVGNGNTDGAAEASVVADSNTGASDTGAARDEGPPDEGNTSADYGAPPPRDAGQPDDNGGPGPEYGAPPPDAGVAPPYGIPPTDGG